MKNNNWIALLLKVLAFTYLIVDVFHFLIYRIKPIYPTLTEAFYESVIVSITKWLSCLTILIGLTLDKKNKQISFYLMFIPAIGIVLLFILKGQLNYLISGSIVFRVGLLEITMFLALIFSIFTLIKKYKIAFPGIVISLLMSLILGYLFSMVPVYNAP